MGIPSPFGKRGRTLFVADDGAGLWGIVADARAVVADGRFPKTADLRTALDFGRRAKAGSALFLQVSDVREIEVKLGPGLDPEERRNAIEFAAEGSLGARDGGRRISYLDGAAGGFRSGILASAFDAEEVRDAARAAKAARMRFRGFAGFKQLLMAEHFSDPERRECAFLFLLGSHGFAAVPESGRLQVRNLPFGVPAPEEDRQEWLDRIGRRLAMLRNRRVALLSPEPAPELCREIQAITGAGSVEQGDWEGRLAAAAVFFLREGAGAVHPALPPPKPRDPRAPGTAIGLAMIGFAALSVSVLYARNLAALRRCGRELARLEEADRRVKAERAALARLEKDLAAERTVFAMLKRRERVSRNLLVVVNLLQRFPLRYTRVVSIAERSDGILVEGESVWQPDLSAFLANFEAELGRYRLALFSDGLSKEKDGRITFRSRIGEGEG